MNDETKAANEALVESMLRQLRGCVSVGDEMTLDHATLIDDAADWIAGEPERIAAARTEAADRAWDEAVKATELEQAHVRLRAVAAAREEQREACAIVAAEADCDCLEFEECCQTKGREALHDGSAAGVIADIVRDTPLTATPLADELKSVGLELEAARALYSDACRRSDELLGALLKAEARVAELEAQLADVKAAHEEDLRAARKHAREALNLRVEREALRGRVAELEEGNVRRQVNLEAERDEAVAALRLMESSAFPHPVEHPSMTKAWRAARAVLAKYPEGR